MLTRHGFVCWHFSFFEIGTGVRGNNRVTVEEECLVWHYSLDNGRLAYECESAVLVEFSRGMAESWLNLVSCIAVTISVRRIHSFQVSGVQK
jgi:hypothetical protein